MNCSYRSPFKNLKCLSVAYKIKFNNLCLQKSLQPSHNSAFQIHPLRLHWHMLLNSLIPKYFFFYNQHFHFTLLPLFIPFLCERQVLPTNIHAPDLGLRFFRPRFSPESLSRMGIRLRNPHRGDPAVACRL